MSKTSITIDFDPDRLSTYTDTHLAMLWHLVQHNPADGFEHSQPGDLAAKVGWEIIRRWLKAAPVEMYHHQQSHYSQHQLGKFAIYQPGGRAWDHEAKDWNPAFYDGTWAPRMLPRAPELQAALADRLGELGAFAGTRSRQEIAQELTSILMPQQAGDDKDQGDDGEGQGDDGPDGTTREIAS
jgi:hypothetical protein